GGRRRTNFEFSRQLTRLTRSRRFLDLLALPSRVPPVNPRYRIQASWSFWVQLRVGVEVLHDRGTFWSAATCQPLWPRRHNESGDKSPHSIFGLVICPSFVRIPRQKLTPTSNCTLLKQATG